MDGVRIPGPTATAAIVFVIAMAISALGIVMIERADLRTARALASDIAGNHASELEVRVSHAVSATSALAALVRQGGGSIRDFHRVVTEMLPYYSGASAMHLAPKGVISEIVPLAGNEGAVGVDLLREEVRAQQEAFIALDSRKLTVAGPFRLAQGGTGIVGRLPVFLESDANETAFWGFTMVLVRVPELLELAQLADLSELDYRYALWRRHPVTGMRETIDATSSGLPVDPVSRSVDLPGATWTLAISPAAGWTNPHRRGNMVAVGVLLSLLVAYLAKLAMELRAHKMGLESQVARRTAEVRLRETDLIRAQSVAGLGSWVSTDGGPMKGSAEACRIFDVPEGSALSEEEFLDRVHPEDREAVSQARLKAITGRPCQIEFRTAGEPVLWVLGTCDVTLDPETGAQRLVCTVQDITERKQREADLRIAAVAFEAQEGMMITDARQTILRVNHALTAMMGYTAEEVVGRMPSVFASGRHDDAFFKAVFKSIEATGAWQGELWNRRKDGVDFPCWMSITAVTNDAGEVTHYVGSLSDITARKAAEAEIERLAFYDALTGLPNRRLLGDRLNRALVTASRKRRSGAILFIDLDDFKTLNDTQGHDVGDILLQQVAERLTGCVREGDTVARLGGDEFLVMLEDLVESGQDAANQSESIGEMILARLGVPYSLPFGAHHQSASIGIMIFGKPGVSAEEILKGADLAMYRAKSAGGNAMRFFDPEMQGAVVARAELVNDLRKGLREGEFRLVYQAQVDREGRLLAAEALVRWHSATRGLVSPVEFIPVAEQTGLIIPLGQWVMETACAQLASWAREPDTVGLVMAVNVSAREFRSADFVEKTLAVLARTGANPKKLMIEFTESVLMDDLEGAVVRMNALKVHGVGFSLDDFGTGYSSLAYVKNLPVNQLKIDKSFVRDVLSDPSDAMISRAIIALAKSLGLAVVAEGVESQAQWDFLIRHGCHAFQGYHIGKPGGVESLQAR